MIVSDARVLKFANDRLGGIVPPCVCIGVERGGEVVSAVVLNHYEGNDIHMSAVGDFWPRSLFRAVGDYVFGRLGCLRMTSITEQDKVISLALRCGAQVEGRLRNHYGRGRDGVLLGFLKEDWPYGIETKSP